MKTSDLYYQKRSISSLKGVGAKNEEYLHNLSLFSVFDVFFHLPFRYIDKTFITKISDLQDNGSSYLIKAKIINASFVNTKKPIFKVFVSDNSGILELVFFHVSAIYARSFTLGKEVLLFGTPKVGYNNKLSITHPEVTFLKPHEPISLETRLTPVYHNTHGILQKNLRKIISNALTELAKDPLEELLPQDLNPYNIDITKAILDIHNPYPTINHEPLYPTLLKSFERLCYEELIAYQLSLLSLKHKNKTLKAGIVQNHPKLLKEFLTQLTFSPTNAQLRVLDEIVQDIAKDSPMLRLVHGDVGSGKTLVAIMATLLTCKDGYQVAMLAPTEILATQHYTNFQKFLSNFNIKVALLKSSLKKKEKEEVLESIKNGSAQVIIGTHALFYDEVIYNNLNLVIIDEQHRFGIEQRLKLLAKSKEGFAAHQLVMTATPIPRTLQIALYSDLDVSTIDEMPKGRKEIKTALINKDRENEIIARLDVACSRGAQAYIVCPFIEKNDEVDVAAVKETFEIYKNKLKNHKVGLLHGAMSSSEKNHIMEEFQNGDISILVATTIIEVGVDVPNATIMVIYSAEIFGLAQLHQLRGRIGRGSNESFCLLVYNANSITEIAQQRLKTMKGTNNGFIIATEDLKLRGPGEIVGTMQAGFGNFRVCNVNRDHALIASARASAIEIINQDKSLANALIKRYFPQYLEQNTSL